MTNIRRHINLVEAAQSGEEIAVALVNKAAENFGRDELSGGNCGTFGLALAMRLQELGFHPTLAVIFRDHGFETLEEVVEGETDIYHIVVMLGERMFDATGETDANALLAIAAQQYRDRRPGFFRDIAIDDMVMHALISSETNWSISTGVFRGALD